MDFRKHATLRSDKHFRTPILFSHIDRSHAISMTWLLSEINYLFPPVTIFSITKVDGVLDECLLLSLLFIWDLLFVYGL